MLVKMDFCTICLTCVSYYGRNFVCKIVTRGMTQGTVMPMAGFIIHLIGERAAMTAGAFLFR